MKNLEEIKALATKKADAQETEKNDHWHGIYYGYIYGYQDAIKQINLSLGGVSGSENAIILKLSLDDAKGVLSCLTRTSAKGNDLLVGIKTEDRLLYAIDHYR